MKLYKLTDKDGQTYGCCQWGEGVTYEAPGKGELCGPGWIHAYTSPELAALLNPIHAAFEQPRLWECEGKVGKTDHGLKVGCTKLSTLVEIPLPEVTMETCVRFGILCAKAVYREAEWNAWADRWLSGEDRSAEAAEAAREAVEAAATDAVAAAAWWAVASADAAGEAAWWAASGVAPAVPWAATIEAASAASWAASAASLDLQAIALAALAL